MPPESDRPWAPGTATGLGPFPGTDPVEAARIVANELPELPYLAALPARGPGADPVGRTAALLVDLHVDINPGGWRLVPRPGRDEQRARSLFASDLDALEEIAEAYDGPLKTQVLGPCSLAEGVSRHVADVRRRLPRLDRVVVQLDEPFLGDVMAGTIPTASGWGRLRAVEEPVAEEFLRQVLTGAGPGAGVSCGAAPAPVAVLRRAGAAFAGLDAARLGATDLDELGEALEGAGMGLLVAVVPVADDGREPVALLDPLRRLWSRVGLPLERLPDTVAVTHLEGLDHVDPRTVPAVLRRCVETGRFLGKVASEGSW